MQFSGKVVVVTGGGAGVGAATPRRSAREGASVVLCTREKEKLQEVAATCGGAALAQAGDVSFASDMEQLAQAASDRLGRIDVLVNNAAYAVVGGFFDYSPEEWRKVMGAGVDGVFHATRAILPHLLRTRGRVVNVS